MPAKSTSDDTQPPLHRADKTPTGTQAISRAATLLRLIARKGVEGARLTDLSKAAMLPHPTVRRILKCLLEEGFVIQRDNSNRYLLGPLNFELGLATRQDLGFQRKYGPVLQRLAQESGDAAYLMARSGNDVVCLLRAEGHFPIQARTFDIGSRRPMGFGAASIAIMAYMDDAEVKAILDLNQPDIDNNPRLNRDLILERISRARKNKYAVTSNIDTFGIGSVGLAIEDEGKQPTYAINITVAGAERFTKKKIDQLYRMIKREISNIQ